MTRKATSNPASSSRFGTVLTALCVLAVALGAAGGIAYADILNVPADYPTIQAAIDAAEDGDEVVVAPGEYFENIDFLGKAITVRSIAPTDPEVVAATIINGNGAYHVVQCVSGERPDTVLSGFTITGGNAVGSGYPDNVGGGMRNDYWSSPTVANCTFIGNAADWGGGMYNELSNPRVTNCSFCENTADGVGAGMCNNAGSPSVVDCVFECNGAGDEGGGMFNCGGWGSPTVTNCAFSGNSAGFCGGGMYNDDWAEPTISNCTFCANTAENDGGGMINDVASSPNVSDCVFENNVAGYDGGAMLNYWGTDATVTGCTFRQNHANHYGGGMCDYRGESTVVNCMFVLNTSYCGGGMCEYSGDSAVINCIFRGNVAEDRGGGMYSEWCDPVLVNCTFLENASHWGGGMFNEFPSHAAIASCVFWDNAGGQLAGWPANVRFSDVQGGYLGTGNIDADPLFVDPDNGDYHLSPGSPCIDAGDNTAVPPDEFDFDGDGDTEEPIPFDLDGNPRFVDDPDTEDTGNGTPPIVDMGAYEFQPPECPADFDDDGDVDGADLAILLEHWGTDGSGGGDVDGNGIVNTADLLALLAAWGECP